jgi:shikimate kinase
VTNAAARRALGPGARTVYLRVSAEAAARRLVRSAEVRPLIAGAADPAGAVAALLERRRALYEAADLVVDGESDDVEAVAAAVAAALADAAAVPALR